VHYGLFTPLLSAPSYRCKPRGITTIMLSAASRPTLAKNARMGHPRFVMAKEKQRREGWASLPIAI